MQPVETCPATLFAFFERLGTLALSALALMASERCLDRPKACPKTVATIFGLALNACSLIKDMGGEGRDAPVSDWLQGVVNALKSALRRATRNLEERKDKDMHTELYSLNDAQSRHNDAASTKSLDSRSTLCKLATLLHATWLTSSQRWSKIDSSRFSTRISFQQAIRHLSAWRARVRLSCMTSQNG